MGLQYATSGGSYGVYAVTYDGSGAGVAGRNYGSGIASNPGVYGQSTNGWGVWGVSSYAGAAGVYGSGTAGSGAAGVSGTGGTDGGGSGGLLYEAGAGVEGQGGNGLTGGADGAGGIFYGGYETVAGDGVDVYPGSGNAGVFSGNVDVYGSVTKASGSFKIDHPLDPANKYLYHSFVESPDMMNIYNGNVTTDNSGVATITLPDWFESLNKDFRYQLTVIGKFAQAIVAREIESSQFQIKTSLPNVKVSWQVTGIRQDAWANAHRVPVEEEKDARLKGFYIHPELYGAPAEKQIEWARHPQTMRRLQQKREQAKENQAQNQPVERPVGIPK